MADSSKRKLRVIFAIRSYAHMHLFRKTIQALADRGHIVFVLINKSLTEETLEEIRSFESKDPHVTYDWTCPSRRGGTIIFHARELLTYRKHLLKAENSKFYPERWRRYLHPKLKDIFLRSWARALLKTGVMGGILKFMEKITPPQADVVNHIRVLNPDAVISTPVNKRYSSMELEYLKAAAVLHIPTALPMGSWDNITAKGVYHVWPDRFLVWNSIQVEEMKEHHRVPPQKIKVVGAISMDCWFPPPKYSSRQEFCRKHGLLSDPPILSYLGSSKVIIEDETGLVREVRKILDEASDPRMRSIQLIFRPHPNNFDIYKSLNLKNVFVIPANGPLTDPTWEQQLFYDTLYHSLGVVAFNSSAMLDTICIDKAVIALYKEEYRQMQEGTFHFPMLLREKALALVRTPEEFSREVQKLLDGQDEYKKNREKFVNTYIRPRGLNISSGEAIVEEVENLVAEEHD